MSERSFFDTNVLVYTDDHDAPAKQRRALDLLADARRAGSGVVSTQVLSEYFVTATRKLGVEAAIARRKVELFGHMHLAIIDLDDVLAAADLQRLHQLSFWDALVLRAAQETGCSVLYSEDLQDGRRFDATTVLNPFR
jgi:predicted nucleic acid-binding protein